MTESVLDLSQSFDERENIHDRNGYIYENIKRIKNIRLAINQACMIVLVRVYDVTFPYFFNRSCIRSMISFGSKKLCKTKLTVPIVLVFLLYIRGRVGLGPEPKL